MDDKIRIETAILNNKAAALAKMGKFKEAIHFLDKALEINPDYTTALMNKGIAYHNWGMYEEAIKWFDKALDSIKNRTS